MQAVLHIVYINIIASLDKSNTIGNKDIHSEPYRKDL